MFRSPWLATLLLGVTTGTAGAADILSLEERDLENEQQVVAKGLGIVDINSTILLHLDKSALRTELRRHYPETPLEEIETVRVIQKQIREGLDALPAMGNALAAWSDVAARTPVKQADLEAAVGRVANAALPILVHAVERSPELNAEIEKRLAQLPSMTESYAAVFDAASAYAARLAQGIDERLREQGIFIQMGAWLDWAGSTTPLHLPGFDTLPEVEFYEVERWQLAALLNQDNKELFDAAQQAAREINNREKSVASLFKESLPDAFVNALKADLQCLKTLDDPLRALQGSGATAVAQLRSEIDDMRRDVDEFIDFARVLQARYGNVRLASIGDVPTLYASLRADIDTFKARVATLEAQLKTLQERVSAIANNLSSDARDASDQFTAKAKDCRTRITENVNNLSGFVNVLVNGREIGTRSLEFSDKVLKHDIASLPERADLDLRRTGARDAGAAVIVRVAASQESGSPQVLDEQQLRLYKVLTYVDVAVSLIFADPQKDTGISGRFQAAPSYSVLLKFGRRDSAFWNELLQPGIGVNIAALDFNKDDALEVGAGLVLSAFRDFLQLGYGYNLNEGSGYWFLGLRFPLPGNTGLAKEP